jgi:hypothetical protein
MREAAFAVPGDLAAATGGYAYARRLLEMMPAAGWTLHHIALPGDFPAPSADSLGATAAAFAALPPDRPVLVDGLAFGALPVPLLRTARRRFVALVHHPLALETGLPPGHAAELAASERAALACATAVIATSATTARRLVADYGVDPARLGVAQPGTAPAARSPGGGDPPRILAVGTVVPRKAYDVLLAALASLAGLPWQCRIAGALDRDPDCLAALRAAIAAAGLDGRIALLGALDGPTLEAEWQAADLFVHPAHFEGFGMAVAEALAHGLPTVASTAGAVGDWVAPGAARLVAPGDAAGLAAALSDLLAAPERRRAAADAAWSFGRTLPDWPETAARVAALLDRALAG